MTTREHAFALRILAGDSPSVAFKAAGYSTRSNSGIIATAAQRLLKKPHVAALIEKGREKALKDVVVTRQIKLDRLGKRIMQGKVLDRDGIKAVEVHNMMTGDNAPQKVDVFGLAELLELVRSG